MPRPEFRAGVFERMPEEQYFAVEAISQTGAKRIRQSLAHYAWDRQHQSEPTDAMKIGKLLHWAVLEPHRFESMFMLAPACDKRSNANKARWADAIAEAQSRGVLLVTEEQADGVRKMKDAVLRHDAAAELLSETKREVSLFWRDGKYGIPCKARADVLQRGEHAILSDLKSCEDASPEGFGRSIAKFFYHAQGWHYTSGFEHLLHMTPAFVLIAVEKEPPYGVACYSLESPHLLAGRHLMEVAYERYRDALATGMWPSYSQRIVPAQVPGWALRFPAGDQ